jgi:hypothetical protein
VNIETIAITCFIVALGLLVWATTSSIRPGPREHDTSEESGRRCWCGPEVLQSCPEWDRSLGDSCPSSCWRCGGRTLVDPYDEDLTDVIIHRGPDDPPAPPREEERGCHRS